MFCFLFFDFELLTPKNFRVKSLGLVCVAQKDLTNQIKLQINRKIDRPSLNRPIKSQKILMTLKKTGGLSQSADMLYSIYRK